MNRTGRLSQLLRISALSTALLGATVAQGEYQVPEPSIVVQQNEDIQLLQRVSKALNTVGQHAMKSVVFVSIVKRVRGMPPGMVDPFEFFFGQPRGQRPQEMPKQEGLGSGFFIDLDKGYVLTNNHVVEDADEIRLRLANGEEQSAKVVGRDARTDIAVVQIKDKNFSRKGLTALPLGDSDKVTVGDLVVAIGAPFGLEASLSMGVVSATGRGSLQITTLGNFIQTDAAINPGNSGGPLVNSLGQAVGINTAIYSRSGGYNGIGFTIPSNMVRRVAEQLINKGRIDRGYIGIALQSADPELLRSLKVPADTQGTVVTEVVRGGPADKAGLVAGDVIFEVNDQKISNSGDLQSKIGLMRPGESAKLSYFRDGGRKSTTAKIAQYPEQNFPEQGDGSESPSDDDAPSKGSASVFGLSVTKVTSFLKDRYHLTSSSGLVVTTVKQDSPGDRVGLRPGDLIVSAGGNKVSSPEDLKKASQGISRLVLRVERAGNFFFVALSD